MDTTLPTEQRHIPEEANVQLSYYRGKNPQGRKLGGLTAPSASTVAPVVQQTNYW